MFIVIPRVELLLPSLLPSLFSTAAEEVVPAAIAQSDFEGGEYSQTISKPPSYISSPYPFYIVISNHDRFFGEVRFTFQLVRPG